MPLLDAIASGLQRDQIASQGCGITGYVSDTWRIHARDRMRHAISQTAARRINNHQAGFMERMGEDRTIPSLGLDCLAARSRRRFVLYRICWIHTSREAGQILIG